MFRRSERLLSRLARGFSFLVNSLFALLVIGVLVPGPHRVVVPDAFGLTEIAPHVWTDAPDRGRELITLSDRARARVADFFGDAPPSPTLVLCATRACARTFGVRGNGLSIAFVAVMVSPGGLSIGTLTHEMTHSRLHRSMGPRNLVKKPFPTWFDEGLATHVANHPRWPGQITPAARQRIKQVQNFWQLDDAFRALGVGRTYRAAAAEVAEIERRAGHDGLLELIARADAGEDFDKVLSEVLAR